MTSANNNNKRNKKRKHSTSSNNNNKTHDNKNDSSSLAEVAAVIKSKNNTTSTTSITTTVTTKTTTTTSTSTKTKKGNKQMKNTLNKNKITPNKRKVTSKHTKAKNKKNNNKSSVDNNNQQIIVLEKGKIIECEITSNNNQGINVKIIKPSSLHALNIEAYIDGLEISDDIKILQNLKECYKIGSTIKAKVITKYQYYPNKQQPLDLSILRIEEEEYGYYYDTLSSNNDDDMSGSIVIGRINRHVKSLAPLPSLMINIRSKNSMVRCCITELMYNPWKDMPLGTYAFDPSNTMDENNNENENDYG